MAEDQKHGSPSTGNSGAVKPEDVSLSLDIERSKLKFEGLPQIDDKHWLCLGYDEEDKEFCFNVLKKKSKHAECVDCGFSREESSKIYHALRENYLADERQRKRKGATHKSDSVECGAEPVICDTVCPEMAIVEQQQLVHDDTMKTILPAIDKMHVSTEKLPVSMDLSQDDITVQDLQIEHSDDVEFLNHCSPKRPAENPDEIEIPKKRSCFDEVNKQHSVKTCLPTEESCEAISNQSKATSVERESELQTRQLETKINIKESESDNNKSVTSELGNGTTAHVPSASQNQEVDNSQTNNPAPTDSPKSEKVLSKENQEIEKFPKEETKIIKRKENVDEKMDDSTEVDDRTSGHHPTASGDQEMKSPAPTEIEKNQMVFGNAKSSAESNIVDEPSATNNAKTDEGQLYMKPKSPEEYVTGNKDKNTCTSDNKRVTRSSSTIKVVFHVVVSADFALKEDDLVLLRFDDTRLEGWNSTVTNMFQWRLTKKRNLHDGYFLMEVEVPIEKCILQSRSQTGIFYKYIVYRNKERQFTWEHLIQDSYSKGRVFNRILKLEYKDYQKSTEHHIYDGMMRCKSKSAWFLGELIKDITGKTRAKFEIESEIAFRGMLPRLEASSREELVFGELVESVQVVYSQIMSDKVQYINIPKSDIKDWWTNVLYGYIENAIQSNIRFDPSTTCTPEEALYRVGSALFIICLNHSSNLDLKKEQLKGLCKALMIKKHPESAVLLG